MELAVKKQKRKRGVWFFFFIRGWGLTSDQETRIHISSTVRSLTRCTYMLFGNEKPNFRKNLKGEK